MKSHQTLKVIAIYPWRNMKVDRFMAIHPTAVVGI